MDPLSITVAVVGLLTAASQTYKTLSALYDLKSAPHEILELMNEVIE